MHETVGVIRDLAQVQRLTTEEGNGPWDRSRLSSMPDSTPKRSQDDVARAARREATRRRTGASSLTVIIAEQEAISDARERARAR